ncbi:MAG: FHA domain-containing protein, partial [bacterium]
MWTIEDLGSKNGTQVNQSIITKLQALSHDDVICLGNIKLVVKFPMADDNEYKQSLSTLGNNYQKRTIFRDVEQLQHQW